MIQLNENYFIQKHYLKGGIRVFPKWMSLNSVNLVNPDKIEKYYYLHYLSGHNYALSNSNRKYILFNTYGYVYIPLTILNKYLWEHSNTNLILLLHLKT